MADNTERLQVMVSPELRDAIEDEAKRLALDVSPLLRSVLFRIFMPDQATVEQCRTLIDERVPYNV